MLVVGILEILLGAQLQRITRSKADTLLRAQAQAQAQPLALVPGPQ